MFCAYPALVLAFAPAGGLTHLAGWEKVVAGATSLSCGTVELTRKNLIRRSEQTFTGSVFAMRPNLLRVRLDKPTPGASTTYLRSGQSLYEYDGETKTMTEFRLPDGSEADAPPSIDWSAVGYWLVRHPAFLFHRGQTAQAIAGVERNLWSAVVSSANARFSRWFLQGLADAPPASVLSAATRPGELARRFDVTLSQIDDHYVYLRLNPLQATDRAGAESLLLVLTRPDCVAGAYRPVYVQVVRGNGQEVEDWKLADVAYDLPGLTPEFFGYVPPPADWKVQRPSKP